jgi:hypothetical protein
MEFISFGHRDRDDRVEANDYTLILITFIFWLSGTMIVQFIIFLD